MTDSLSIAVHAFAIRVLMFSSVDETLLPGYVNLFTSFSDLPFKLDFFFLVTEFEYFRVC